VRRGRVMVEIDRQTDREVEGEGHAFFERDFDSSYSRPPFFLPVLGSISFCCFFFFYQSLSSNGPTWICWINVKWIDALIIYVSSWDGVGGGKGTETQREREGCDRSCTRSINRAVLFVPRLMHYRGWGERRVNSVDRSIGRSFLHV